MEPLKSNQAALQIDMMSSTSPSQTAKKIKTAKFVPYEPTKAAVGPVNDRSPTDCSISIDDRLMIRTPVTTPIDSDRTLYRYSKTVYVGKKSPVQNTDTPKCTVRELTSHASDKFRPINVVDPIRQDHVTFGDHVTGEEDYVVDMEESYTESRAVAHLQAVNDACNQKIVQLRDERMELKKELELQFQINTELKNLLVASMGDEMHHDVEMLVRQRTQLSSEMQNYCQKIQDNQETLDKMNIMADMWRSKYIASRVMVDELAGWKAQISVRYNEARSALGTLLNERHLIKTYVDSAFRYLTQIHSTLCNTVSRPPYTSSSNLVDVSKQVGHLAENVKFKFLGNVPISVLVADSDDLTPAERAAAEVLTHSADSDHAGLLHSLTSSVSRFHPDTRFELLTLNCCQHCKGEITVI